MLDKTARRVGIAIVGLGGGMASTAVAGIELMRMGLVGSEGFPLSGRTVPDLVDTSQLVCTGWDFDGPISQAPSRPTASSARGKSAR